MEDAVVDAGGIRRRPREPPPPAAAVSGAVTGRCQLRRALAQLADGARSSCLAGEGVRADAACLVLFLVTRLRDRAGRVRATCRADKNHGRSQVGPSLS